MEGYALGSSCERAAEEKNMDKVWVVVISLERVEVISQ